MSLLDDLAAELFSVRAQIKDLEEQEGLIKEAILSQNAFGRSEHGSYLLDVTDNLRFDKATARAVLSESELERVSVAEPNSTLVRTLLPFKFADCQKNYGFKVSVILNPDLTDSVKVTI